MQQHWPITLLENRLPNLNRVIGSYADQESVEGAMVETAQRDAIRYHRIAAWFKPGKRRMKVTYKRPVDDLEYNSQKADEQKEIDRILDKISKGGYESLTAKEKELLFKMSDKK